MFLTGSEQKIFVSLSPQALPHRSCPKLFPCLLAFAVLYPTASEGSGFPWAMNTWVRL